MFEGMIKRVDDRLNPILVKELRQSTNSRILTVLVIGFLAVQLFSMYIQIFMHRSGTFDRRQVVFPTVLIILLGACAYGVIPNIANRFYKERCGDSIDLIYTTVLSPFAIIAGKMFSAMGLIILLYSLCAPFIFISYLFPGIDILTIFWALWYSFWIIAALAQFMILAATINTSQIMHSIMQLAYFGGITMFALSNSYSINREIFRRASLSHASYTSHLSFMLFWLLLIGFMYSLAVCSVSSAQSNRAVWPRFYAAGFWLIGLLFVIVLNLIAYRPLARAGREIWVVLSSIVFLSFLAASSGERSEYGKRLRRHIPRKPFFRTLAFPFFSGEVNGFIYSILFMGLTILIFYFLPRRTISDDEGIQALIGVTGYFTWYWLLAIWLKRRLRKKFPNINAFLVMLFSVIFFTLAPMMLAWGVYRNTDLHRHEMAPFLVLSFGFMWMHGYQMVGIIVSWALSVIGFCMQLPFFVKRISEFKPLEIGEKEGEYSE
jgi:hypothetical protein